MRRAGRKPMVTAGLVAVFAAVLGMAWLEPLRAVKREVLLDRALEALTAGLDAYRVAHGAFPLDAVLAGGELAQRLRTAGALDALPVNPDTGAPYGAVDLEPDHVWYTGDAAGATYLLEAMAPGGERVIRRVDGGRVK